MKESLMVYLLSLTSFKSKVVFSTFLRFTSEDKRATKVFNLIANSVALRKRVKTMTFIVGYTQGTIEALKTK
jgi:hypothetical protein